MGPPVKGLIVEKLDRLPGSALQEVLEFVDFLTQRKTPPEDPVLAVAGILAGSPLSPEEIERELYGPDAQ